MCQVLQAKYRVHGRVTKWLLREAMKEMIPEGILTRPKVGFRLPVNEWFRGPMKDNLFDHLLSDGSLLLWTMLNIEIWLRQTGVNIEETVYKTA